MSFKKEKRELELDAVKLQKDLDGVEVAKELATQRAEKVVEVSG